MKRMAKDLSGTGCPAVCQDKDGQEQELLVKDTRILWFVRNKIVRGLSVCQENVCGCLVVYHGQEDQEICQCLIASDDILPLTCPDTNRRISKLLYIEKGIWKYISDKVGFL
jgi:hypothetical protein